MLPYIIEWVELQHAEKHSLETSYIAGLLAGELGANVKLAKRAGLLHDIGKALDHEIEGTHISIGMDLAKKYKEYVKVVKHKLKPMRLFLLYRLFMNQPKSQLQKSQNGCMFLEVNIYNAKKN